MGFHTFDPEKAAKLEDAGERYRYCSREELLGALAPEADWDVADLGSGTGFYTDDVAPHVAHVHAVDVQDVMHDAYREKHAPTGGSERNERTRRDATREPNGIPDNVDLVTADVADLPLDDASLDGAVSTMTFHEFASEDSLAELARVLRDGARLAVVDWSAAGDGVDGPPVDERYDATDADSLLTAAGFTVERADERVETFAVTAVR